ncbi:hypothetical protein HFC70_25445 [Agrobacterium sp. a22-2]|uniref:hypothetical protein n=1 Tax=Agrobacterium sp. a22-2 TaxID=2283840 RepID=UPI001446ADAF|nr:hypothetical protein [Agrobacterium sp. a22-2]NKN39699.1 hypothetical protein [Agrobacterium sp. a22-2]
MAKPEMPSVDLSAIEERLADHHERFARTAVLLWLERPRCGLRKCRRDHCCTGPMVKSERTSGATAAQKFMGLSGAAAARLPLCVALAPDWQYENYLEARRRLQAMLATDPTLRLPRYDRQLTGRLWDLGE